VPSTITVEIPFTCDSIITQSVQTIPELEGVVHDRDSKQPLAGAVVNIQYNDSTSDSALTGRFTSYFRSIGAIPGQAYKEGMLSTQTDSTGRFSFRLLPDGIATIAVLAKGYTITRFTEQTTTGQNKYVHYYIKPYTEIIDSQYTITVWGSDSSHREEIQLEKQQYSAGLTHYLSKVILTKATIRQIPESPSALLVRSGSPYDNCYLIAGVPLLAPFHFGGYPYADIDGVMVSTLDKVNVTVDRIGGAFPNVSGALIEADPGIYRPAPKQLKKRKEFSIDFSTISQDFLLSFPFRKQDYLQIGFTRSEDHSLQWLEVFQSIDGDANISINSPVTFGNLTVTGKSLLNKIQAEYFSWLAYDGYGNYGVISEVIPWGMASVKMYPVSNKNISLTTGGGHQYFADGIRVGHNSFMKKSDLTNVIVSINYDSIVSNEIALNISGVLQVQDWRGYVKQRDTTGLDTSINRTGNEMLGHCRATLCKNLGPLELSSSVLLGGINYGDNFDGFIDAGLSALWKSDYLEAGLTLGKISNRPDIRGLPDSLFRQNQSDAYLVSLPMKFRYKECASFDIQPYARYQRHTPQLDPLLKTWNPSLSTPVKATGADCDLQFKPVKWLELGCAANISHAYRDKEGDSTYEWNIPYSIRGRAHFIFYHNMLHVYIDGKSSVGLPDYDFVQYRYRSLPGYQNLDFSLQYRSPVVKHRFVSRYDAYFIVTNILSHFNVRTYYWNTNMIDHPIKLRGPIYTEIGARFAFRL
jgi:hypothetical protein